MSRADHIAEIQALVDSQLAFSKQKTLNPISQGQQDPTGIGMLSSDGLTVTDADGNTTEAIIVGNPSKVDTTIRITSDKTMIVSESRHTIRRSSSVNVVAILSDPSTSSFYVGKPDGTPPDLYTLDVINALGYTPEFVGNLKLSFSKNGKHIVIVDRPGGDGSLYIPNQVIKWTWLLNYSLTIDPGTQAKLVAWKSATHHSITIPENPVPDYPEVPNPTPVTTTPQIPPGVPNPYVGSGHYKIQWELEDDTNHQINPQRHSEQNQSSVSWTVYDDRDGHPHMLWYGERNVERVTTVTFRPRYVYNGNLEGHEDDRLLAETDPDCPPYCSRIHYGPAELDFSTYPAKYRRLVSFLAGFIWDKGEVEVCPHISLPHIPIFYTGYISNVAQPAPEGQDPLGPGNIIDPNVNIFPTVITDYGSVGITEYRFANAHILGPTKDGAYTNWEDWQYPWENYYTAPTPPKPELDGCQPTDPGDPPVYFQPPYMQYIPNIFAVPFSWCNGIGQSYLWTNNDGAGYSFKPTKTYTSNSTETPGSNRDMWLFPQGVNVPASGDSWKWYMPIYQYVDSGGSTHRSSLKYNDDIAMKQGPQPFGPFEWYVHDQDDFLKTGTGDITIPPPADIFGTHRVPMNISNEMMLMAALTVGGGTPLPPIPLVPPLTPPFIVQDYTAPWSIMSKFVTPQTLQSVEPMLKSGGFRYSRSSMNDATATVNWLKKKTVSPHTLYVLDFYTS